MTPPQQNYAKPFSIRQYTLSCRQKNIFDCWPFPDKYLLLCQKHGVTNVLPPIHPPRSVIQSSEDVHFINSMQKDNQDSIVNQSAAKESNNSRDVDKQPSSSSVDCSRSSRKNDRRRKGKQKKRWMVDILAVAKPCSLEDVYDQMNKENGDRFPADEKGLRSGDKQAAIADHGCDVSELAEDCSNQKLEIHGYEEEYPNLLGQNRWILKGQIHRLQIQV